ncbi:GntR family transcriptional regulator [Streptomonospora salina]|uniref:DNA-binding GntR family transcriptional regulator n=1 Tax=Streptomonospora salina TaxID=104205 RepID=A0A841EBV6_9ACTN|nr:GntR family transcriptional regulator [Streptomonospora salina]MBB5998498.1 DNA-binding GntR family transcriptional regulator [Streptomonospora salina]
MSARPTPWGTYSQIAETLRQRITSGALAPGASVPSEAALGEEFHVARSTIRRALAALEADRLIRTLPGTGRVVCDPDEAGAGDSSGHQPQYRRIADELRHRIDLGDLAPGDALPSESALVHAYGVSRGTARQALSDLEGSGLVVSVHGKGRFVRDRGAESPPR